MADLLTIADWPARGRGRVVVEATEWSTREAISSVLRDAGYATSACPGPAGTDQRCPSPAGEGCTAAEEADVVVHTLHPADPRNREVLVSLRRRMPDTPLVVEVPEPLLHAHPEDYEGCILLTPPISPQALLDGVAEALRGRPHD